MVTISSLWLAIVLSAVFVFIVSSIIHMVFTYHRSNAIPLEREDEFRASVGPLNITPGDYMVPGCASPEELKSESVQQKLKEGPVITMTVMPNGPFQMGKNLGLWFVYSLLIGFFSAYIASNTLDASSSYLTVMRIVGVTAFMGYCFALIQDSIWWYRKWSTTFKFLFDGLIYALVTGGTFGWLWPAA